MSSSTSNPRPDLQLINIKQLEAMTGLNRRTIYRHLHDGTLPAPLKIGGANRWRVTDIERFIHNAKANRRD